MYFNEKLKTKKKDVKLVIMRMVMVKIISKNIYSNTVNNVGMCSVARCEIF
jgi:hypothetical protein